MRRARVLSVFPPRALTHRWSPRALHCVRGPAEQWQNAAGGTSLGLSIFPPCWFAQSRTFCSRQAAPSSPQGSQPLLPRPPARASSPWAPGHAPGYPRTSGRCRPQPVPTTRPRSWLPLPDPAAPSLPLWGSAWHPAGLGLCSVSRPPPLGQTLLSCIAALPSARGAVQTTFIAFSCHAAPGTQQPPALPPLDITGRWGAPGGEALPLQAWWWG